jgi:hypothetical protein
MSVILPKVIQLSVILPNVILLSVILPNVILLSVIVPNAILQESNSARCHFLKYCSAVSHSIECHFGYCHSDEFNSVIMLTFIDINIVRLSTLLNVILLSVILTNVILLCLILCHFFKYCLAECHSSECRSFRGNSVEFRYVMLCVILLNACKTN